MQAPCSQRYTRIPAPGFVLRQIIEKIPAHCDVVHGIEKKISENRWKNDGQIMRMRKVVGSHIGDVVLRMSSGQDHSAILLFVAILPILLLPFQQTTSKFVHHL